MMLSENTKPDVAINLFISKVSEKLGFGKEITISGEQVRELLFEVQDELFSEQIPDDLQLLLNTFEHAMEEATDLKCEIYSFLSDKYEFNDIKESELIEDDCDYVYGIDHNKVIIYTEGKPATLPKCCIMMEKMGRYNHYLIGYDGKYYDSSAGVLEEYDFSKLTGYLEVLV